MVAITWFEFQGTLARATTCCGAWIGRCRARRFVFYAEVDARGPVQTRPCSVYAGVARATAWRFQAARPRFRGLINTPMERDAKVVGPFSEHGPACTGADIHRVNT
jgi:hypothetical protein